MVFLPGTPQIALEAELKPELAGIFRPGLSIEPNGAGFVRYLFFFLRSAMLFCHTVCDSDGRLFAFYRKHVKALLFEGIFDVAGRSFF